MTIIQTLDDYPAVAARPLRLRLCFVGPMLGVNPGWVTTLGEVLAALLPGEC